MIQPIIIIIIIITFSPFPRVICNSAFNYCEVGAPNKCLGDTMKSLELGTPTKIDDYILTSNHTNYESCSDQCAQHSQCYMASFSTDKSICTLYRTISFRHSTSPLTKLFLWICCNPDKSFNASNRCPGVWKYKPRSQTDNKIRSFDPLVEFKGLNRYDCQMKCLNNAICGAINYLVDDKLDPSVINCQLIIQFPVQMFVYVANEKWYTLQWQCSSTYKLPEPKKECLERVNHLPGYWIVQNASATFDWATKNMIYFYTLDYKQCLNNCALYAECKAAWFSLESYDCILEGDNGTSCVDETPPNSNIFIKYIWKNCDQAQSKPINDELSYTTSCRTLVDNTYTYIYPITCGHLPNNVTNLFPCWRDPTVTHGTTFSTNILCQANHSFRVYDRYTPSLSSFNRFANVSWIRVFTGYDSFWLVNVTDDNFPQATNHECETFDSSFKLPMNHKAAFKIVKREEWFPTKSRKPENRFPKHPVNHVIITDTEVPFCNCFSVEACSSIMRRIQLALLSTYYSIPYSFIVTGDGVAYESRGWDLESAVATDKYNPDSISIALCGQYKKSPGVTSLSSVKQLIKMSIERKKLSEKYILYIYNDLRPREYPYDGLRRVIELWPHYRGNIKDECQPIKNVTLLSHVVTVFCCILIIVVCIHVFHRRIWHRTNCALIRKCRIETMYGNIFSKPVEILPQIVIHNMKNLRVEDNFISPLTSPVIWIEDCPTIWFGNVRKADCQCKSAVFSCLDLGRLHSNLVNVGSLTMLPEIRFCARTIVFIFQRHAELGNGYLLILHFQQVKLANRFIMQLHQNHCICDSFTLTRYCPSSLCFEAGNECIEVRKDVGKKNRHIREATEQKYAIVIETNQCFRYCN